MDTPVEQELQHLHMIELTVNRTAVSLWVEPGELLLEVLRDRLQLLGTKAGCAQGECGACTILLNGEPVYACLMLAVQAHECEILTIEGLQDVDGGAHPVQRAFIEHNAVQCGFCTPGMILSIATLLDEHPTPTDAQLEHALRGHTCRCGAYANILKAIRAIKAHHTAGEDQSHAT